MPSWSDVPQRQFGGEWSDVKLQALREYLAAYTTVLKKQRLSVEYIDGFAGAGQLEAGVSGPSDELLNVESSPESANYRHGSPVIALETDPPFSTFHFIEKSQPALDSLRAQVEQAGHAGKRIHYRCGDANAELKAVCLGNWDARRAVAFLDPFAMHLSWATIETIAATKAIDMWLLFPAMAVNRMMARNGQIPPSWETKLNDFFGCGDWRNAFYEDEGADLFGTASVRKLEDFFENLRKFITQRLQTAFPGALEKPLILRNSAKAPIFFLCFACANPSLKAQAAAMRIAAHIVKTKHR